MPEPDAEAALAELSRLGADAAERAVAESRAMDLAFVMGRFPDLLEAIYGRPGLDDGGSGGGPEAHVA